MQVSPRLVNSNLGIFRFTERTLPVRTNILDGGGTPASPVRSKAPRGVAKGESEQRLPGAFSVMFREPAHD